MAGKIIFRLYRVIISRINLIVSAFRIFHFRMLGVRIGKRCFIAKGVIISGDVTIGDDCNIGAYCNIGTAFNGKVEIGNDCHIGKFNQIGSSGSQVKIGNQCIFAPFVMITDGIHTFKDATLIIKHSPILSEPIEIMANVWLGSSAMIMQGVTVGEGAVIGAKSLVKDNIPANAVAAGVPSKVISYRKEPSNAKLADAAGLQVS